MRMYAHIHFQVDNLRAYFSSSKVDVWVCMDTYHASGDDFKEVMDQYLAKVCVPEPMACCMHKVFQKGPRFLQHNLHVCKDTNTHASI